MLKRIILVLIVLIVNVNLCLADNAICYDNSCFTEVYRYPKLGFYAFVVKENGHNSYNSYNSEPPIAKLARLFSFDDNRQGRLVIAYLEMPNVSAFKNAPKTNLGSLEQVARKQGTAVGHLSINLAQSGYIDHTSFILNNGEIFPMRKYKEWRK